MRKNIFTHQYECSNCNEKYYTCEPPYDGRYICDPCRVELIEYKNYSDA